MIFLLRINWYHKVGRAGVLVIYSAEVVECTGYQKNILDICSSVDIPLTKGLHFDK